MLLFLELLGNVDSPQSKGPTHFFESSTTGKVRFSHTKGLSTRRRVEDNDQPLEGGSI